MDVVWSALLLAVSTLQTSSASARIASDVTTDAVQLSSGFLPSGSREPPPPTPPPPLLQQDHGPAMSLSVGLARNTGRHSAGRFRLLQLFAKNPLLQQPNIDDLPISVLVKLIPIKIQDLIERNEVLETTLRLQLTWVDKRLSWDPVAFSNLSEIVIPPTAVWSPDIAILNSVHDIYHVVKDLRFELKLENNGRIWWHPTGIVRSYCKLELRFYPFDRQTCRFILESPTLDVKFMNLTMRTPTQPVDRRMFTDGETWRVLDFGGENIIKKVGSKTSFSRVEFIMYMERANIYHIVNFILPAIILSAVQVLFFFLPPTHPQRVGSSTTILLSVIVFQTVVVSQLPKTSTSVPLLSIYIFFVIIVSGLSVSASVFVAKFAVYADKQYPFPNWLYKIPHPRLVFRKLRQCLRKRRSTSLGGSSHLDGVVIGGQISSSNNNNSETRQQLHAGALLTNWQEVLTIVHWTLMVTSAATAIFSPVVLFVIMPKLGVES